MCRLFGFRSVIQSQVHRSLVGADNALAVQSRTHCDGWGVAWYHADVPHVVKSGSAAIEDAIFRRVSGVVASQTVIAHIRKATTGDIHALNAHPFQFGTWIFAHNGQIHDFERHKAALVAGVAPNLRRFVLGDTDSEVLFYLILTALGQRTDLHRRGTPIEDIVGAIDQVWRSVRKRCDAAGAVAGGEGASLLSGILTDGQTLVAACSGKELRFSTFKTGCLDRDSCPHLADECEAPTQTGFVNHLLVSSEPLQGDNVWHEMTFDEVVGVDWRMRLHRGRLASSGGADGHIEPVAGDHGGESNCAPPFGDLPA